MSPALRAQLLKVHAARVEASNALKAADVQLEPRAAHLFALPPLGESGAAAKWIGVVTSCERAIVDAAERGRPRKLAVAFGAIQALWDEIARAIDLALEES